MTKCCGKLHGNRDRINTAERWWSKKCLGILRGYAVLDSDAMQLVPSPEQQEGWKMVALQVSRSVLGSSLSAKCCSLYNTCGQVLSQLHVHAGTKEQGKITSQEQKASGIFALSHNTRPFRTCVKSEAKEVDAVWMIKDRPKLGNLLQRMECWGVEHSTLRNHWVQWTNIAHTFKSPIA